MLQIKQPYIIGLRNNGWLYPD